MDRLTRILAVLTRWGLGLCALLLVLLALYVSLGLVGSEMCIRDRERDHAKTNIIGITELGLVQMTRKRTRESLEQVLSLIHI